MSVSEGNNQVVWKETPALWAGVAIILLLLGFIFLDGLSFMVKLWNSREEYGHGFIIPFITLFLIWQKKDQLEKIKFNGSWLGFIGVLLGLSLFYIGELSSLYVIIQYAFIITLLGFLLSITGMKAFKIIIVPLLILLFMIPLPNFFLNNLSSELQLISSKLGVLVIRLFDISVFLEGNVIDLGVYKLQVVEACSGLNYLFPLMTLGFITAYFFTGSFWKKAIIFLSTIPITVFMNSFRIGVIGVTVEYWGPEMAEGFLHDFEGWAVFMSCIGVLIFEMWILAGIGKDKLPLREAFGLDYPEPTPENSTINYRVFGKQFYASAMAVVLVSSSVFLLPERVEIEPDRKQYVEFPLHFEEWKGNKGFLKPVYLDALKLTDYVMNDYIGVDGGAVNFYSAYYASQRKGASIHSPRSCIPGGGWRMTGLAEHNVKGVKVGDNQLVVNRLVIQKDQVKQLVYYWFQQRGRVITNEYLMKWYLFWDSLTKKRTDGALMRVTTMLRPGVDIEVADHRLEKFVRDISGFVPEYIPE